MYIVAGMKHERLSKVLAKYTGEQAFLHIQSVMDQVSNTTTLPSSGAAPSMNNNQQHGILGSCSSAAEVAVAAAVENNKNKVVMMEMAAKALEELYKLLRINEPLWMKAKGDIDGGYKLDRHSYQKLCQLLRLPTATHGYCPTHHYEASKHTALVPMNSLELVDAFLDSVSIHIYIYMNNTSYIHTYSYRYSIPAAGKVVRTFPNHCHSSQNYPSA